MGRMLRVPAWCAVHGLALALILTIPLASVFLASRAGGMVQMLAFSVLTLVAFVLGGILSGRGIRMAWHYARFLAALVLYAILHGINLIDHRRRVVMACVVFPVTPFALLGLYKTMEIHAAGPAINQLFVEVADFINTTRLEPDEAPHAVQNARRLVERYDSISIAPRVDPSLEAVVRAIRTLYTTRRSLSDVDIVERFSRKTDRAIDILEKSNDHSEQPGALLRDVLLLRLHLLQSLQGDVIDHTRRSIELLVHVRSQRVRNSVGALDDEAVRHIRESLENARAGVWIYCAEHSEDCRAWWEKPESNGDFDAGSLWRSAEKVFVQTAANRTATHYARARAANNHADLLLRWYWTVRDGGRVNGVVATLPRTKLHVQLGHARTALLPLLKAIPRPEFMVTLAQVDYALAVYKAEAVTFEDWNRLGDSAQARLEEELRELLGSATGKLDMALHCGIRRELFDSSGHALRLCALFGYGQMPRFPADKVRAVFAEAGVDAGKIFRRHGVTFRCSKCARAAPQEMETLP